MGIAVRIFGPAVAVAIVLEFKIPHRAEIIAEILVDLGKNPVRAVVIYGVFKTRVFAVRAITEITLDKHDLFRSSTTCWGVQKPITSAIRG